MSMVHTGQPTAAPGSANTPAPSLPLWAQVAIERLDACTELRNQVTLDELLTGYARTYGAAVPPETDLIDDGEWRRIHVEILNCARSSKREVAK